MRPSSLPPSVKARATVPIGHMPIGAVAADRAPLDPSAHPRGAMLPTMPPHAASTRAGVSPRVASYTLHPEDHEATSGWLRVGVGGNTLSIPDRMQRAAHAGLGGYTACARQLTAELSRVVANDLMASDGLGNFCAIVANAVGAESTAILPTSALGLQACLQEHNFDAACHATLAAALPCQRLAGAVPYELRHAAEDRLSLNMGGVERTQPAATEAGQVALREPESFAKSMLKVRLPPLSSALVTPIADPETGSTVALLISCNGRAGHFALHDELLSEAAAYHLGLVWLHHIQMLRLAPMPGAPLVPPDEAAIQLRDAWQAPGPRRAQTARRAEVAHALARVGGGSGGGSRSATSAASRPLDALCSMLRRTLRVRAVELRHALLVTSATGRGPDRDVHDGLEHVSAQWERVVLLELQGEVARVGGAAAAARVPELLARPLHLAAQHAADYHIKQRRSATKAPADAATAPAPAVIDVPEAPAGAPGVNAPSPAAAADAPSDSFKRTAAAASARARARPTTSGPT